MAAFCVNARESAPHPEEHDLDKNDRKPKPGDVTPVVGICLVATLMVLITAIVLKAELIIFIALAGVLAALAYKIRQGSN
jgi:hypothetical protein